MKTRILLIVGSDAVRGRIERLASTPNNEIECLVPGPEAWAGLSTETFDLVYTRRADLPGPLPEFVDALKALPAAPDVVILTPEADPIEHARVIAEGGLAAVYTRLPNGLLRSALGQLSKRTRARQDAEALDELDAIAPELSDFVSESAAMKELTSLAERVALADSTLLVAGETGVGKEWLARSIHQRGPRSDGPFVAVNCAALPEGLFESELFGHVEGAFTGASRTRRGYFELAHGGTIFLDEIGELPMALQAKLLRVLQEDEIRPVGGEDPIAVDARIIVATNRDLGAAIQRGEFREDLFYRISVVTLRVPPLRERVEDIEGLVSSYLERFALELKRPVESVHPEAMRALRDYAWPGNVRELINVMERSVLLSRRRELGLADLPGSVIGEEGVVKPLDRSAGGFEERWLEEPLLAVRRRVSRRLEREYLERVLERSGGRVAEAAHRAGISQRTLFDKMRVLGLRKEDFKYPKSAS